MAEKDDLTKPEKTKDLTAEPDTKSEASEVPAEKKSSGGKVLLMLVGIAVVAFIIVVGGFEYFSTRQAVPPGSGTQTESSGPEIGGPFTLTNHNGEEVTDKTFRGQHILVFFGYTYCPDICPTTLSDVSNALDLMDEEAAEEFTPVFISVDPQRDTPEHLKEYVSFFHPRTVGMTGTEEQIKAVTQEYRAYYRINDPLSDDPLDYLVDHTAIVYVMGPDGNMLTHFSHGTTPEAMAERLGKLL